MISSALWRKQREQSAELVKRAMKLTRYPPGANPTQSWTSACGHVYIVAILINLLFVRWADFRPPRRGCVDRLTVDHAHAFCCRGCKENPRCFPLFFDVTVSYTWFRLFSIFERVSDEPVSTQPRWLDGLQIATLASGCFQTLFCMNPVFSLRLRICNRGNQTIWYRGLS